MIYEDIKSLLIDSIDTERALKEFRKLNEYNAILDELKEINEINKQVEALIMFYPAIYKYLKPIYKTELRLIAVLDQHPNFIKECKLNDLFSEDFVIDLLASNKVFGGFDLLDVSIKTNRKILAFQLKRERVFLNNTMENIIKNDIELYTSYISSIYNHKNIGGKMIVFKARQLNLWSKNFHGTAKPLLKKTENLDYFLSNYTGYYAGELVTLMCSNKTFKEKLEKVIDLKLLSVIPSDENSKLDFYPEIREAFLIEQIKTEKHTEEKISKTRKKV